MLLLMLVLLLFVAVVAAVVVVAVVDTVVDTVAVSMITYSKMIANGQLSLLKSYRNWPHSTV